MIAEAGIGTDEEDKEVIDGNALGISFSNAASIHASLTKSDGNGSNGSAMSSCSVNDKVVRQGEWHDFISLNHFKRSKEVIPPTVALRVTRVRFSRSNENNMRAVHVNSQYWSDGVQILS